MQAKLYRLAVIWAAFSSYVLACPSHTPLKLTGAWLPDQSVMYGKTVELSAYDNNGNLMFYCPANGSIVQYQWVVPSAAFFVEGQNTPILKCKLPAGVYEIELTIKCSHNYWNTQHAQYPSQNKFVYYVYVSNYDGPWHIRPDGDDENDGNDWTGAFRSFDTAVQVARSGNIIKIAPGEYSQAFDFKGKNLVVKSEDPSEILTGWDLVNSTIIKSIAGPAVAFKGTESTSCKLMGFTVIGGSQRDCLSQNNLTRDLELHLKLDENQGNVAFDSSGNNRHGEFSSGTVWSLDGYIDGAISVANLNPIVIPGYKGVLGSQSRTAAVWVKTTSNSPIIFDWGTGKFLSNQACWEVRLNNNGFIRWTSGGATVQGYGTKINDGKWHHIAVVLKDAETPTLYEMAIYIDGKLEPCTYTLSGPSPMINTLSGIDVTIGKFASGVFDDVRIYSRGLTEEEISLIGSQGGIRGNGALASISMCTIRNTHSGGYGGGISGVNGEISKCYILNNSALHGGGGLAGCRGVIRNCIIAGNQSVFGTAIYDSTADIINCTIADNLADEACAAIENCTGTIKNCILWGNTPNQYGSSSVPTYSCVQGWTSNPESPFNFSDDPLLIDAINGNYHISLNPPSPCTNGGDPAFEGFGRYDIDLNSRLTFGCVDVGADEIHGVYVVGKALYGSIQEAIDKAADGDTIIVAEGHYYENIKFKGKRIIVQSSNPNDPICVNNTRIIGSPNSHVISFENAESRATILSGFTIAADGIMDAGYSGIHCYKSSPQINNCSIKDLQIQGYNGGAIWIENGSPRIEKCIIEGCNQDGIRSSALALEVHQCRIVGNGKSGIYHNWYDSTLSISNSLMCGNGREGIYAAGDLLQVANCTISQNVTEIESYAYGIYAASTNLFIIDSIIWQNGHTSSYNIALPYSPQTSSINYSCLGQPIQSGMGNIYVNPQYVDSLNQDYHLQTNSPCLDAGSPLTPYENETTPNGSRVNMGAYGNTLEATLSTDVDTDGDCINDNWELTNLGGSDPSVHDSNDDVDGDGFANFIESLYGYDPTVVDTASVDIRVGLYGATTTPVLVDPTYGQSATIKYMTNKMSDVLIEIKQTESPYATVWNYSNAGQGPGVHTILWNGRDNSNYFVQPGVYDIYITVTANGGTETDNWTSTCSGHYEGYMGDKTVRREIYNPYANLPFIIDMDVSNWYRGNIRSYAADGSTYIVKDYLFRPGANRVAWDGRWRSVPEGTLPPGAIDLSIVKTAFSIQYLMSSTYVPKGGLIVHYEQPIQNVRCNPYRILPVDNEVVTITYDLACQANVTVEVHDPTGNHVSTLLDNQPQQAGKQSLYWHGRSTLPEDPAQTTPSAGIVWYGPDGNTSTYDGYYLTEGDYRIVISSQELNTTVIGTVRVCK